MVYVADIIEPVSQSVLGSDNTAAGLCESVGLEQHVDIAVGIEIEVERVAHGAVRVENFAKPGDDIGRPEAEVLYLRVGGFFEDVANAQCSGKVAYAA